jgi:hypothetical protein
MSLCHLLTDMQSLSFKFNFYVEKKIKQSSIGPILHWHELFRGVNHQWLWSGGQTDMC